MSDYNDKKSGQPNLGQKGPQQQNTQQRPFDKNRPQTSTSTDATKNKGLGGDSTQNKNLNKDKKF